MVQITAQAQTQGELVAHFAHSHAPQRLLAGLRQGMMQYRRTTPVSFNEQDSVNHNDGSESEVGQRQTGPQDVSFTSIASYGNSSVTSTIATSDRIYLEEGEGKEDKVRSDPRMVHPSSSASTEKDIKDTNTAGLSKKAILQLKLKRKILELDEGGSIVTPVNLTCPNLIFSNTNLTASILFCHILSYAILDLT